MSGAGPTHPAVSDLSLPASAIRQGRVELGVGILVVACLGALLAVALGGISGAPAGTVFRASFGHIDGIDAGSDVRIAGVSVGRVVSTAIDPNSFLATVTFRVRPGIALPVDTSAAITSEGLLGGDYLSIAPGGDRHDIPPGGLITATQGAIGLQALLGQFIGSVTGLMDAVKASGVVARPPGAAAGPAPVGGDLGP